MSGRSRARRAKREAARVTRAYGERRREWVSLCEMCAKRDTVKEADLQETWALVGREPFRHIWCGAIDGPEDMRWAACPSYEEMR